LCSGLFSVAGPPSPCREVGPQRRHTVHHACVLWLGDLGRPVALLLILDQLLVGFPEAIDELVGVVGRSLLFDDFLGDGNHRWVSSLVADVVEDLVRFADLDFGTDSAGEGALSRGSSARIRSRVPITT
jgi:hypothetical protein